MKIYHTMMNGEVIHDHAFPMNSVILSLDHHVKVICKEFKFDREKKLEVYVWLPTPKKWVRTKIRNDYSEVMYNYFCTHIRKRKSKANFEEYMKHDRRHKGGGGGTRIFNGSITDYECRKDPFHDFRRCWN